MGKTNTSIQRMKYYFLREGKNVFNGLPTFLFHYSATILNHKHLLSDGAFLQLIVSACSLKSNTAAFSSKLLSVPKPWFQKKKILLEFTLLTSNTSQNERKKSKFLPPTVCRFQEKLFLGEQISTPLLPPLKLCCLNISHLQIPSGHRVEAHHHVQLLHLPPTSWSQWLFSLDPRDPEKESPERWWLFWTCKEELSMFLILYKLKLANVSLIWPQLVVYGKKGLQQEDILSLA